MSIIDEKISFVKEQIDFQEKQAKKFSSDAWRQGLHKGSADKYRDLVSFIESQQKKIEELEISNAFDKASPPSQLSQFNLSFEEVQALPEDLIKELSFSDSDKTEFLIQNLIAEYGGLASLDRILVGIFKKTGEVHKRNAITAKVYRMVNKGMLFSVPTKKGVYSIKEISEEEAVKLFG